MKKICVVVILLTAGIIFSCKKDKNLLPPVILPPPSDAQTILLKDIVIQSLPSPYYHFEYDGAGFIIKSAFSAGLRSYSVNHVSKRISEIESTDILNNDKMVYHYEDGKVFLIQYFDQSGKNYRRCFVTYNTTGQLVKIEWELKLGVTGFAIDRTLTFDYYADANLKELTDHRHFIAGQQTEASYTELYENYDNKINVDGFTHIHDNNDHLILLPNIKLQKNNPSKTIRSGNGINYQITHTYTYNEINRPIQVNGDVLFTSGPDAGKHFQSHTTFTYYP